MHHAIYILQMKQDCVLDTLVEEAVSEILLSLRKNYSIKTRRQQKALMREVFRAFDRRRYEWKKREHRIESDDPDTPDNHESIRDPRDFENDLPEQVDRDREISQLHRKLSEVLTPFDWTFLTRYLDRDEHDPPHTERARKQFSRLCDRLKTHLGDAEQFSSLFWRRQ
jgi:hypothetical protein